MEDTGRLQVVEGPDTELVFTDCKIKVHVLRSEQKPLHQSIAERTFYPVVKESRVGMKVKKSLKRLDIFGDDE